MSTLRDDLKARARALHRAAQLRDPVAIAELRRCRDLKPLDDDALVARAQRRHCLSALAQRLGLSGWSHLTALLDGTSNDFGTALHIGSPAQWSIWSASYAEAQSIRAEHGGWLLPYRHQYMVVDEHFVRELGLDPDDPDWARMGRDWVEPRDPQARLRLFERRLAARLS